MLDSSSRVLTESVAISGPVGELESIVDIPEATAGSHVAVVCHPHPLQGGTMTNKVVHVLAKSFNSLEIPTVRFNYRGVGKSVGGYAEGIGETADAVAAIDWALSRWPQASLYLSGFSFGGAVAIRAATERSVDRLITVAPAVDRVEVPSERLPHCPWLVIQGDQDDVVDPSSVQNWLRAQSFARSPELVMLSGVGHFFHGRLNELKSVVVEWLKKGDG
jgi:alpha/beta superfamily hydrolase